MSRFAGWRFNEAAGFTRRKRRGCCALSATRRQGFNEAAGFTRRKLPGPPGKGYEVLHASMRPPDLPGGNK